MLILLAMSNSVDGLSRAEFMSSGEFGEDGTIVCVDPVLRDESLFVLFVDLKVDIAINDHSRSCPAGSWKQLSEEETK